LRADSRAAEGVAGISQVAAGGQKAVGKEGDNKQNMLTSLDKTQ
jgi:hypothetical protein